MLDNELTISEFVPGAVSRPSLQNAVMPYFTEAPTVSYENGTAVFSTGEDHAAEGTLFVGAFYPGIHLSADVQSLSSGSAALMEIAPYDGSFRLRVLAKPDRKVGFEQIFNGKKLDAKMECKGTVPPPPFSLSAIVAGPTVLVTVRKNDTVSFLASRRRPATSRSSATQICRCSSSKR